MRNITNELGLVLGVLLVLTIPNMVSAETRCCAPQTSCNPCLSGETIGDCYWSEETYCCECSSPIIECQEDDTRCDPDNNDVVQKCVDGSWMGWESCPGGCFGGECLTVECNTGERRCDPDDPYGVQKCENGAWVDFVSCAFGECYGAGQCPSTQCTEGDIRCNPDDSYDVEKCISGFWQDWKTCSFGECYGSGECPLQELEPEIVQIQVPHVSVDNEKNMVTVTVYIKNDGGDMTENWLVELQPRTFPLSIIGTQSVCDLRYPQNVHKEFRLDSQETATIVLESIVQDGKYDLYLVSTDKCCVDINGNPISPSCNSVGPYGYGQRIKSITMGNEDDNGDGVGWIIDVFEDYFFHILVIILIVVAMGFLLKKNKGGPNAKK